jgi:hypothetical protein
MSLRVDQGSNFGKWDNETARLMYSDVMPALLNGVKTGGSVVDLGGGNGLLKEWIPLAVTVDSDKTKNPDITADILEYEGNHDLVVIRYVLHYLPDVKVKQFFNHLSGYHSGQVLVIQFVNEDIQAKLANSVNEVKYFRTESQLLKLLSPYRVSSRKKIEYTVSPDFYRQRLGHTNPTAHEEAVVGLLLEREDPSE